MTGLTHSMYQRKTPLIPFDRATATIPRVGNADPIAILTGPLGFSTAGVVDLYGRWIFDPNGYYRALGVSPKASRKELMAAYMAAGGPDSVRLTKILLLLLNERFRWVYDTCGPGEFIVDDEIEKRKTEQLLDKQRANKTPPPVNFDEPDTSPASTPDTPDLPDRIPDDLTWKWGYFLWGPNRNTEVLRLWQACLCRVYAGRTGLISVGLAPNKGEDAFVYLHDRYVIAFLAEDAEPSDLLASKLINALS